jgi:GH35 family endo-1,4-beta-xylanase
MEKSSKGGTSITVWGTADEPGWKSGKSREDGTSMQEGILRASKNVENSQFFA